MQILWCGWFIMNNKLLPILSSITILFFFFFKSPNHIAEKSKSFRASSAYLNKLKKSDDDILNRSLSSQADMPLKIDIDNSCMPHEPNLNRLRAEISVLELERNKLVNVSYKKEFWRHLSLEDVSPVMAQALIKNDGLISNEINLDNCKDLICVINTIYNDESKITGHLLYWFYLKTGYFVSVDRNHPELKIPSSEKLEKIIYQKDELPFFWAVGQSTPVSMTFMPTLKSLYRSPYNPKYRLLKVEDGKEFTAAGLASSAGWIFFVDNCLTKKRSWEKEELEDLGGRGIECFYHEFTHHLDFSLGNLHKGQDLRPSQQDEWMKLSGWKKVEEQKDNTIFWHWESDNTKKYITTYAQSSPAEDYAESWTFSRLQPNKSMKSIPEKFQYFKKNLNLSYNKEGLTEQFQTYINKYSIERASQLVSNCTLANENSENSGEEYQNCLNKVKSEESIKIINYIKNHFWEGCQYLKNKDDELAINEYSSQKISNEMNNVLKLNPDLKETLLSSKILRDSIKESLDSDALIMYCTNLFGKIDSKIEQCFRETAKEQITLLAEEVSKNAGEEIINYEVERYLKLNPFKDVKDKTAQLIQKHLQSLDLASSKQISDLINECVSISNRQENNLYIPYSGREQYIESGILGCLNNKIPQLITSMISNALGMQKTQIQDYQLKYYVSKFSPSFIQELHAQILLMASAELYWMEQEFELVKINLQTSIKSKYKSVLDIPQCLADDEMLMIFEKIITSKHPQSKLNFHTLKEWNLRQMKKLCANLTETDVVDPPVSGNKQDLNKNLDIKFLTIQLIQDIFNRPEQNQLAVINKCTMLYSKTFFEKNNIAEHEYSDCQDQAALELLRGKILQCDTDLKGKPVCRESLKKIKSEVFNSANPDYFKKMIINELTGNNDEVKKIITRCYQNKVYEQNAFAEASFIRNIIDLEVGKNNFQNSCVGTNIWQNSNSLMSKLKMIFAAVTISQDLKKEIGNYSNKKGWSFARANFHIQAKIIMRRMGLKNRQKCIAKWKDVEKELRLYFNNSWEKNWFESGSAIKTISSERERIIADYLRGK